MLQCLPFESYFPPARVCPFLSPSFLSFFISFPFVRVPLCVSVCIFRFDFLLFAVCFCFFLLRFIFFFVICLLVSLCFPGVLSGGVLMLVFLFSASVLHPLRCVRAWNPRKIAHSLVCPFLISCFLSLPSWMCDFFSIFAFDFSTSSCYFHPAYFFWVVCGPLGFCGDLYSVPHASDTYAREPPFSMFLSEV